jgi:hypothetical protein
MVNFRRASTLGTRPGARTMAFDAKSKKIYALAGEGSADFAKKVNVSVGPFYPNTFFPNTVQVLSYSKK